MLKRFKQLKKGLQEMVISDQWSSYTEDDVAKAKFVKDTLLDDNWWDKVDYILSFTSPIYDVLRRTNTKASSLHLVYEMWDSMIEKVKNAIYQYEGKEESEGSTFYEIVHYILIDRWTKSSTPLHCIAHSLNPSEDSNRVPPHQDMELTRERVKCFKRFFLDVEVALKLLAQPCSSSCCERNWSTYSFIHSLKRNKMAPYRAEDLVFVHSNLRLLSRNTPQYHQEETKMWDVAGDDFGSLDDCGILEIASLSLDEPELEGVFFNDDDHLGAVCVSYILNITSVHVSVSVSCPVSVSVPINIQMQHIPNSVCFGTIPQQENNGFLRSSTPATRRITRDMTVERPHPGSLSGEIDNELTSLIKPMKNR
ncbi:hypothetical protein D0Y65_021114 [Glycine soja]|uniref:HAT C-terminal dimerisation domain-containing protein n=1 Tax=Glycine soja TaxID=3848 RepID=A0A445JHL1_GLYSO|nr:hypothetical protein D0Y65_021114 [Glycine soja]